jgi:hypothetical protein
MPRPRLPMRKIRDVLRLSAAGMSKRKIAASHINGRQKICSSKVGPQPITPSSVDSCAS